MTEENTHYVEEAICSLGPRIELVIAGKVLPVDGFEGFIRAQVKKLRPRTEYKELNIRVSCDYEGYDIEVLGIREEDFLEKAERERQALKLLEKQSKKVEAEKKILRDLIEKYGIPNDKAN